MYFNVAALSLAVLAGSASAQLTQLTLPKPGSTLTAGCNVTVQVGMGGYPENIDNVAVVIGLAPCYDGTCYPASALVGDVLYQGPYTPRRGDYYANYTVMVPRDFAHGNASLNIVNLFLLGAEYAPVVDYLNIKVHVVA